MMTNRTKPAPFPVDGAFSGDVFHPCSPFGATPSLYLSNKMFAFPIFSDIYQRKVLEYRYEQYKKGLAKMLESSYSLEGNRLL